MGGLAGLLALFTAATAVECNEGSTHVKKSEKERFSVIHVEFNGFIPSLKLSLFPARSRRC